MTRSNDLISLRQKISKARKILSKSDGFFTANLEKIFHEFDELNLEHSNEIWALIRKLLKEIKPEHYIKPRIKSPHSGIEYFSFYWKSKVLKRFVTLEFALNGEYFFYISLR